MVRIRDVKRGYSETFYSGDYDDEFLVKDGDLLIGMDGEFNRERWQGGKALLNQRVCKLIVNKKKLSEDYLYHFLPRALKEIEDRTPFVTVKHLSSKDIKAIQIPLPPLDEQRRIAAILDKADALRRKRKRAIELLDSLTQSIFLEMFTSETRSRREFKFISLGEVCELIRDGVHKTPKYVEAGVPFVTVKNIVGGLLDLTQTKFVSLDEHLSMTKRVRPEPGDILVSKDGTIGIPCVVPEGPAFSIFVSVALLRLKRSIVDPVFLSEQIKTHAVQKQIRESSKGIAIRHLHLNDFAKLKVMLPPIRDQKRFESVAACVRNRRKLLVDGLNQARSLFDSLQHRAFSGQL